MSGNGKKGPKDRDSLLNTVEAAQRLGLSPGTLQNWRIRGQGPDYILLGKAVRYLPEEIARFIEQGRVSPRGRA